MALDEPGLRAGGHQGHASQASGDQVPEEREPAGTGLGCRGVDAEDLPVLPYPSALTPVATMPATSTTRPSPRTFMRHLNGKTPQHRACVAHGRAVSH